jgi:hypothetical protein
LNTVLRRVPGLGRRRRLAVRPAPAWAAALRGFSLSRVFSLGGAVNKVRQLD